MLKSLLENRKGPFAAVAHKFEPDSPRTAAQLMAEFKKNPKLIGNYYTFNTAVYSAERGNAILCLFDGSPLIKNSEAVIELIHKGNYLADKRELTDYLEGSVKVFVKALKAEPRNRETALVSIDEYDLEGDDLTSRQRTLAEAIYGSIESGDYSKSMEMFKERRILPEIRVLNPEYVMDNTRGKYLVRACAFQRVDSSLVFNAAYRELGNHLQIRGVPKAESTGGPSGDWTPKKAIELVMSILNNYVQGHRKNVPAYG